MEHNHKTTTSPSRTKNEEGENCAVETAMDTIIVETDSNGRVYQTFVWIKLK